MSDLNGGVIDTIWSRIAPQVYIQREDWERGLEGWDAEIVGAENGELAFVVFTKGPEFHFISLDKRIPITMKMIRQRVQPLIDQHGYAETRTPKDDTRQRRFNELIGFSQVGDDEFYVHYRITILGAKRCP